MKIRTAEELYDKLSQEFAWRILELDQVKVLVRTSASNRTRQHAVIRAGVAMLYAHWEGFIKEAATAYLNFVAEQELTYNQLSINFVAMGMKRKLNESAQTNRAAVHNEVAELFVKGMSAKCKIPWKTAINTKSNLSSKVLKDIIYSLGLDYSHFATKEKLIDNILVDARNNIAHGQHLFIDQDQFFDLFDQVLAMMRLFKDLVDNAATLKIYRNTP